jgi:apolipoprotein N-acyltransferase
VFDRWFDSYRWWWCALSGLLLVASFAPFACATCGWIALVPAWWVITRSERVRWQPIRHGYVIGLIYFGGVFWWISNVTAVGAFFLVLYLALYPAIWFLLMARFVISGGTTSRSSAADRTTGRTYLSVPLQAFGGASLWVVLEWWRSWFLTGFNWNELGISQAPSVVFRQLAAFGGVHLISFVLIMVNILWAEGILGIVKTLQEKRVVRPSLPFGAALFIVASCFALGWHHLQRHRGEPMLPSLTFACVQPDIPQIPYDSSEPYINFQNTENAALQKMEKLSLDATKTTPDLLVWPEATIDEGVFQDRPLNDAVHDICRGYGGYFLLGSQDVDYITKTKDHGAGVKIYNCAYLFTPHGEQYDEYRKTRLVILGEFVPFRDAFTWLTDKFPSLRKAIPIGMDFTPGPGPRVFAMNKPPLTFAPLICFEDTLPEVTNKAVKLKPDFFITITNDGWYTGWCAAWGIRQHLNHAVFRCIEHDRPMIRCANTGVSCIIDQNGTVTERFLGADGHEIDVGGIFARTLEFYPTHGTRYEIWGDWIVLISSLVSVMLGIRFFYRFRLR